MNTTLLGTDTQRVQRHLQSVEAYLRTVPTDALSPELRQKREHALTLLQEYWKQGQFPKNITHPYRVPCFIDHEGTACAVAHIMLNTGETALPQRIQTVANNAYVTEMQDVGLEEWVAQSGFTVEELRLIQPTYHGYEVELARLEAITFNPAPFSQYKVGEFKALSYSFNEQGVKLRINAALRDCGIKYAKVVRQPTFEASRSPGRRRATLGRCPDPEELFDVFGVPSNGECIAYTIIAETLEEIVEQHFQKQEYIEIPAKTIVPGSDDDHNYILDPTTANLIDALQQQELTAYFLTDRSKKRCMLHGEVQSLQYLKQEIESARRKDADRVNQLMLLVDQQPLQQSINTLAEINDPITSFSRGRKPPGQTYFRYFKRIIDVIVKGFYFYPPTDRPLCTPEEIEQVFRRVIPDIASDPPIPDIAAIAAYRQKADRAAYQQRVDRAAYQRKADRAAYRLAVLLVHQRMKELREASEP